MKLCNIDFTNCKCCGRILFIPKINICIIYRNHINQFLCDDCITEYKIIIDKTKEYTSKGQVAGGAAYLAYKIPGIDFYYAGLIVDIL